ncbi:MAG: tetratricopeptide repeat protein [Chitinophagaceae bacterium]
MATDEKQAEVVITKSSEERLVENTRHFWSKNSKFIVGGLAGLLLLIGGYLVYKNYFQAPAEAEANEAIWTAQLNYKNDSFRLALNGDGTKANPGFLKVINKHGGTKAGNLARFYAGTCYLQLADFNNAIKYLEEFTTDQPEVALRATGSLGDAYAELGKNDKAAEEYKKASTIFEKDEMNSAEYVYRLAQLYDKMGKNNEAIAAFRMLKEKYPQTPHARDADKYLGKLGEVN